MPEVPLVELRAVSKSFVEGERERTVLKEASLAVPPGQWLFLLGKSGSGKSTLLNLISGIDLPERGEVLIQGRAINRMSERERTLFRREKIGFVFQSYNLIPTLTVVENLLLPLELLGSGRGDRLRSQSREEAGGTPLQDALALLEQVGLADRAKSYPDRLSGGEQQRVAVARALIHRPLLVLADEPTGNLDAETGREVLDLFERLLRPRGTTLVLVTHSAEVARRADRLCTIKAGQLEAASLEAGLLV